MAEVGDRVGAIRNADPNTVYMYGYGTYEGMQPCPLLNDIPNPRIKLDDGSTVWGMECWWGPEDKMREAISEKPERTVQIVKPER